LISYYLAYSRRSRTRLFALEQFWSDERVNAWNDALFTDDDDDDDDDKGAAETCSNLICLAPHAHAYWSRALFALRLIKLSDDKKRLDVQFFWLRRYKHTDRVNILWTPFLPADLNGAPNNIKLFDCTSERKIRSGDIITLHTDDPEKQPLPSMALLEMQWILHRVSALSGAEQLWW